MSDNPRLPERLQDDPPAPRAESDANRRDRHERALEEWEAFVADALAHHARTGEWPPDPVLDEVADMRRSILAEHGNDYSKVLDWYVELGTNGNGRAQEPAEEHSVASRR